MTDTMTTGLAPWTSTDPDERTAPVTLDVPVTFRLTLTPDTTPDDVALMIAMQGPELTATAATSALHTLLGEWVDQINENGTYFHVGLV